jgi:4-methyl-5(b-hydroxyethyl)-thiazole monophosphate biosynthesis
MSNVIVFLADGFEEIEGLTVVDLLRRAGIKVTTVSIKEEKEIMGAHQIQVMADVTLSQADFDGVDMLVLPGGMPGTLHLGECKVVTEKCVEFFKAGKEVAAICAAPSVLGDLGILEGKRCTCYPGFEDRLKGIVSTNPVEADGNVTTSRGMGTAIPFALKLIEKLINAEKAEEIKDSIIY